MKKLALISAMSALLCAAAIPAHATGSASSTFTVTINLTPMCYIAGAPSVTFNYNSNQSTDLTGSVGGSPFTVTCTTGLAWTAALDDGTSPTLTAATDSTTGSGHAYTDTRVASGPNANPNGTNLTYKLLLGGAAGTGNQTAQALTLSGTMAMNQWGTCITSGSTCAAPSTNTNTRTLMVSY